MLRSSVLRKRWFSGRSVRSHTCGELRSGAVDSTVRLCGWVDAIRPFGPLTFVSLRDRHGLTQLVFSKHNSAFDQISSLRLESVLSVEGQVRLRPEEMVNPKMSTGEIEVLASGVEILNVCTNLPMKVSSGSEQANEDTRLQYRYLDLRRPLMQNNLRIRSDVAMTARNYLCDNGFLEVETPTLFKSTPEGAREFLVPTRTKNAFYALPQSPQQYKQLLMVGGMDRYFQVARCYRDEGGRADRQPEFTQIDLEMSFVNREQIMKLIEGMLSSIMQKVHPGNKAFDGGVLQRMSFQTAMENYGVDKPDIRYELRIHDVSDLISPSNRHIFVKENIPTSTIRAININQLASNNFSRRDMDNLQKEANVASNNTEQVKHMLVKIGPGNQWKSSLTKSLSDVEVEAISKKLNVSEGDVIVISAGQKDLVLPTLGRLRQHCAQLLFKRGFLQEELRKDNFKFLWIVDFPMFEEEDNSISATHHPFTAPHKEELVELQQLIQERAEKEPSTWNEEQNRTKLLQIKAQHFDIVCNGWELGGGSIRIHQHSLQLQVLDHVLNLPISQRESFAHLLEGLSSGCPPHGGIALGLDRLVAILCSAPSLRDVIAFPKSASGKELMTGSPGPVMPSQLKEYHIAVSTDK